MARRKGRQERSQCWLDPALYREIKTVAAILGREIGVVADELVTRGLPILQKRANETRARQVRAKERRTAERRAKGKADGE